MKVTVVVPTYDLERFADTLEAVNSLLGQTYGNKEVVVIVDRNEELYSRLRASLPSQVRLVLSEGPGLSRVRNAAIQYTSGDIIAFMDDDAVADKNWLLTLVRNYRETNVVGVGGSIRPLWVGSCPHWISEEIHWIIGCTYKGSSEKKRDIRNNFGSNISFRSEVFDRVRFTSAIGRIDDKQFTADDTEFSIRVLQTFRDSRIIYDPEAIVYHRIYPYRLSLKYAFRRAFGEGLSKAYVAKLHKKQVLSTEKEYLMNVFTRFLPDQIKKIFEGKSMMSTIGQVIMVLSVVGAVLIGYVCGVLKSEV